MSTGLFRFFATLATMLSGTAIAAGRDPVGAAIGAALAALVIGGLCGAAAWFDSKRKARLDANPGATGKGFFDSVLPKLLWGTVALGILFLWWIATNGK